MKYRDRKWEISCRPAGTVIFFVFCLRGMLDFFQIQIIIMEFNILNGRRFMISYAVSLGSFGGLMTPALADAFRKSKLHNLELSFTPYTEESARRRFRVS